MLKLKSSLNKINAEFLKKFMNPQIISPEKQPLGKVLLRLRGATQNLKEAMSANDCVLILKRRIELSKVIEYLKNANTQPIIDTFVASRISCNIDTAIMMAIAMLHNASSYLSAQFALA